MEASQVIKTTSRHADQSVRVTAGARSTPGATRMAAIIMASRRMIVLAAICRTATLSYYRKFTAVMLPVKQKRLYTYRFVLISVENK